MSAQVLDPCCGARMMWFDKDDPRAVFGDNRTEETTLCDGRTLQVRPDMEMDFRRLPFPEDTFRLVVLDPPHLERVGTSSWTAAKYGTLLPTWREDLRAAFEEAFRVLRPGGVLVLKWSENQVPLREVLSLTQEKPLFGHRTGRRTTWATFIKPEQEHATTPRSSPDPVINQARTALDACSWAADAHQRRQARQDLADHAETYITHLLDEIDHLTEMIRDLDQQAVREDPAHDTDLEAAHHEAARLRRALDTERQQALRYLQRAASSVRRAYQDGYTDGLNQTPRK